MNVLVVLLLLAGTSAPTGAKAASNIGCLFSKTLCRDYEWCYDDFAFGRCLSLVGHVDDRDMYRYDLQETRSFKKLERELQRLFLLGYQWSHPYTQCVLQDLLFSIREGRAFERDICEELMDTDLEGALGAVEGEDAKIDPRDLAYVAFTPSNNDPRGKFADELYVPPKFYPEAYEEEEKYYIPEETPYAAEDYDIDYNDFYKKMKKKSPKKKSAFRELEEPKKRASAAPWEDAISLFTPELYQQASAAKEEPAWQKYLTNGIDNEWANEDSSNLPTDWLNEVPDQYEEGPVRERIPLSDDELAILLEMFLKQSEKKRPPSVDEAILYTETTEPEQVEVGQVEYPEDLSQMQIGTTPYQPIYTEGGIQYVDGAASGPTSEDDPDNVLDYADYAESVPAYPILDNSINYPDNDIIPVDTRADIELGGFSRNERLDVKKPGPNFKGLLLRAYHSRKDQDKNDSSDPVKEVEEYDKGVEEEAENPVTVKADKNYAEELKEAKPEKRVMARDSLSSDYDREVTIDIHLDKVIEKENVSQFVSALRKILNLPQGGLSLVEATDSDVLINFDQDTSSFLTADKIVDLLNTDSWERNEIYKRTNYSVLSASIADPSAVPYSESDDRRLFIVAFAVCGVMAALLLSAVALYIYRRHSKSKDKLQKLSQVDEEPSKDYQDLCRARMASKTTDKPENVAQRMRSVSKESEGSQNSPSSRSSTSSWSEEPVTSNMDISTGHMVLSYMEDHLKNKDRLEQEWLALCAYEAEPCSTAIATKAENKGKNRFQDCLPFDHSRVVLSEVSNISSSDYINASTITDHDPRNPAYILTQGALQQTAADFWQLVWEQGSVVIVMLTKLTEGGQAMCHRYWPEEGAELYHIYEVHLVSEHIWCEDYLVRSFYLKNVKTGETRTVTQFHFLSWPDQGIPSSIKAVLEFRRKVNKSYRGRSCPIVVHCSDGVGRSGTYCLMDMVLNRMAKGAKEIDIAATLEHIRDQRAGAVATRAQFEFTLMAVAEEVHAILKALPQ